MKGEDRSFFVWLSVLSLILIISVSVGAWVVRGSILSLRSEQLHFCERDNVQRAEDNLSHYADFQVDSFVYARFTVPTKTETATQKQITAAFAGKLKAAVAAKSWVPLTDCSVVVTAEGSAYQPPQPVALNLRVPPPAAALDSQTAGQPSPPGSLP